jgi:tetratricopeptide (TPR) repeat protein
MQKESKQEGFGGNMVDFTSRVRKNEEMKDFSIDDNLYVGGKKYHIQTNSTGESRKIVSILFVEGRVLDSSIFVYGPDISEAALTRLVRSVHNRKVGEMRSLFEIAERLAEKKHTEALNKIGSVFLGKRMYDEAIRQLDKALEIDPDYAEAQNNLGLTLNLAGRDKEALEFCQKAIANQPNYGDFHNNLGVLFCKMGRYKEGIEELGKAVRLGAKYGEAYFNLGLAHLKIIQDPVSAAHFPPASVLIHRALENFERAIDLTPHFKDRYFQSGLSHLKNNMIGKAIDDFSRSLLEINKLKAKQREICYEFYLRFLYQDKAMTEQEIK